ncbi:hypothetical protein [Streptomyces sp. I05A-00742]|uniref:hypothetical protein n=1 Tax=Streptomyces sp. I05A-00742 TaxID=2732853 RepID=UPI0014877520|nr:hypothetical protein [Streptomyces sp. I05A-00742]
MTSTDDLKNLVGDGKGNEETEEWSRNDILTAAAVLRWLAGEDEPGKMFNTAEIQKKITTEGPQFLSSSDAMRQQVGLPSTGGSEGPDGVDRDAQHSLDQHNQAVKNAPAEQTVQGVFNSVGTFLKEAGNAFISGATTIV